MKNSISEGEVVTLTAPVGGVVSGQAYMIGGLLVIAAESALVGVRFAGVPVGVFSVPKPDQEAWTECQTIYFDAGVSPDPLFTNVVGSPALPIVGVAARAVPLSLVLALEDTNSPIASPPALALNANAGTIQVVAFADLANGILTVTVNGQATVLTEGSGADFLAETSDEITATNLGAALAAAPGITASVLGDTITITVTSPSTTGRVRLDGAVRP